MSNVIQLNVPSRIATLSERHTALVHSFAAHRRIGDDVFWLKENAELLNILESTGAAPEEAALDAHRAFYDNVEKRMGFFPQYYRFVLSITLDLEALGMPGTKGAQLVDWVADQGLARSEMSDLQRAEARRLMARRGRDPLPEDAGLEARLRGFMDRSEAFAMPNKKAAYELTHIVFYLSEYGRCDPELSAQALQSLEYAGLLAFLDLNADLLAEVCVALRYAGHTPPQVWEDWLGVQTHRFAVTSDDTVSVNDDYHEFLVSNWLLATAGERSFAKPVTQGRMRFDRAQAHVAPLRELSEAVFAMDDTRSGSWHAMQGPVADAISAQALEVLVQAEASTTSFETFFEGFARVGMMARA